MSESKSVPSSDDMYDLRHVVGYDADFGAKNEEGLNMEMIADRDTDLCSRCGRSKLSVHED